MSQAVAVPRKPALVCADCGSRLVLCEKPAAWGKGLVYLCERRPACRGLMSAHPNGEPCGVPATQEVRTARRFCHGVFDVLWRTAETQYEIRDTGAVSRDRATKRVRQIARQRAYRFIAAELGMSEPDCHISKIDDLELLRAFYRAAKSATPEIVRAWAKAQREQA